LPTSELEQEISLGYVLHNWMSEFITEVAKFQSSHNSSLLCKTASLCTFLIYRIRTEMHPPTSTSQSLFVHYYRQLHLTFQTNLLVSSPG